MRIATWALHLRAVKKKRRPFRDRLPEISKKLLSEKNFGEFFSLLASEDGMKAIVFTQSTTETSQYTYTFANDNVENNTDYSLSATQNIYSNKILPYIEFGKQNINRILFMGSSCYGNTFGTNCNNNSFLHSCAFNTFENNCYSNIFGNYCFNNTFGNYCNNNIFGNHFRHNTFGNVCQFLKFSAGSSASTIYSYYKNNHFGDGCQYIVFKGTETASLNAQVQNYNFAQGLQGTSSEYLTVDGVRNRSYETKVARNSAGELKIYCEADLVQ